MSENRAWPADQVKRWPIKKLVPSARNARTHSDAQIAQIAASIREWGWTIPILVDEDGNLIAGHGRVLAARQLDLESAPTMVARGWTEAQKRAYMLADNRLAEVAEWDDELLQIELRDLQSIDFDIRLAGFDELYIAHEQVVGGDETAEPDIDLRATAVTMRGDLWRMGDHCLLCGDCRSCEDVDRALQGRHIQVAFTSPPYAQQRVYDPSSGFEPIKPSEYVRWFAPVAANVARHINADGSWFVNIKAAAEGLDTELYVFDLVLAHAREWGWHFATEFCWERNGVPKQVVRRFKNQFEPVYQFARGDWKMRPERVQQASDDVPKAIGKGAGNTTWAQNGSLSNAAAQGIPGHEWFEGRTSPGLAYPGNRLPTFASTHQATGHPAAFPVGLPKWFTLVYSDPGEVVFDPFCGSGSTILAATHAERCGVGVELAPRDVDLAILRWEATTKGHAMLEETGETFDQVRERRLNNATT
ncbi:site-specific DNA-methyltransferase [Paraburkholderia sp. MM6662-R1]|uniref:site-specific DNA-methyltransferase n=1 Tax=Paraburkholderia sp. MM6662-R1 TaxID=2991066 RepID=UPI003D248C83